MKTILQIYPHDSVETHLKKVGNLVLKKEATYNVGKYENNLFFKNYSLNNGLYFCKDSLKTTDTSFVNPNAISVEKNNAIAFTNDWALPLILFSYIIIAGINFFIKSFFKKMFSQVLNNFHNRHRNNTILGNNTSILTTLHYYITISLLSVGICFYAKPTLQTPPIEVFGGFLLLFPLLQVLQVLTNKYLGYVFNKKILFEKYNKSINLSNQILGLVLLPVVTFFMYGPKQIIIPILFITGLIFAFFLITNLLRLFLAFFSEQVSIFHQILYLCTLGIIPFLIVLKLVKILLINT